jgi:hypothetical protein
MPLASIIIVRNFYAMNFVQGSKNIPKPPQNRTLWTMVMPLRKKTVGYVISDNLQMLSDESQTASRDRVSAMAIRTDL